MKKRKKNNKPWDHLITHIEVTHDPIDILLKHTKVIPILVNIKTGEVKRYIAPIAIEENGKK